MIRLQRFPSRVAALAALLIAAWAACPAMAAGTDSVTLKDRQTIPGVTILKEGYDVVEIDKDADGKADQAFPAEKIARVVYGDAPASFRQGQLFFKMGRFPEAAEKLKSAKQDTNVRSFWINQHANFLLGECLVKMGRTQEARKTYQRVLETSPEGRLFPDAVKGIGLCLLLEGKAEDARREFQKLLDAGKFGEAWELRGKLLVARALSHEGSVPDALDLCDAVAAAGQAAKDKTLLSEAAWARADVLFTAKRFEKAYEAYMQIAAQTREHDFRTKARVYNAIGDALLGANRVEEALLAYLRVRVLYFKDANELPRALYGAARCFTIAKKANEARELVSLLEKEYPDSAWTKKAREELGG